MGFGIPKTTKRPQIEGAVVVLSLQKLWVLELQKRLSAPKLRGGGRSVTSKFVCFGTPKTTKRPQIEGVGVVPSLQKFVGFGSSKTIKRPQIEGVGVVPSLQNLWVLELQKRL